MLLFLHIYRSYIYLKALVLCRACLAPQSKSAPVQRSNIFSWTCTVNGKICKFVIDFGACENVVLIDVVQTLSLVTEAHHMSYSLSYFYWAKLL